MSPHLTSLAITDDSTTYATGGFSHDIYIGSTTHKDSYKLVKCDCGDQRAFLFSSDAAVLFAGGRDGMIHVIDVANTKIINEHHLHRDRLRCWH